MVEKHHHDNEGMRPIEATELAQVNGGRAVFPRSDKPQWPVGDDPFVRN